MWTIEQLALIVLSGQSIVLVVVGDAMMQMSNLHALPSGTVLYTVTS